VTPLIKLIVKEVGVFLGFPGKKKSKNAPQRTKYTPTDNEFELKKPRNPPFGNIYDKKYGKYGN
jgi:hypothetical protein